MDSLAEYIGMVYTLYDSLDSDLAKGTIIALVEKVCDQEMDDSCHSAMFNLSADIKILNLCSQKRSCGFRA